MLAVLMSLISPQAHAAPATYTLEPQAGGLWVLLKYDRKALIKGHDHVIEASTYQGTVTWDPEDLSACKVEIRFPADALVIDPPGSRSRAGLEGETPDGDKKTIKGNMLGKHQIEASKHPDVGFTSSSCVANGDKVDVTGDLTLHGIGKSVTASMKITADGSRFTGKGTFTAGHIWGFDPYTALLGSLRNDDTLTFHIDVSGNVR